MSDMMNAVRSALPELVSKDVSNARKADIWRALRAVAISSVRHPEPCRETALRVEAVQRILKESNPHD